jgi:hypothetical protein
MTDRHQAIERLPKTRAEAAANAADETKVVGAQ